MAVVTVWLILWLAVTYLQFPVQICFFSYSRPFQQLLRILFFSRDRELELRS